MTTTSMRLPVPNAIVFIRDPASGPCPEPDEIGEVWANPSCLAVGTLPDSEGETEIVLGGSDEVEAMPSIGK